MPSFPSIGLVTVTYNSGEVLTPFLKCTARQTLADYRLIVIDNASTDRTVEMLKAESDERIRTILNADNRGVAEGNNQGIEQCRAEQLRWVLLINNDTEFAPDLLESLLRSAAELDARVLVPRITYYERPDLNWFSGGYFSWWRGFQGRHEEGSGQGDARPRITQYAPTCCMLVRVDVFDEVGLMDPAYFVEWDDTDFCWRLNQRKIPIYYDPRISFAHKVGSLTGGPQSPFHVKYYSRNQIYLLRKHFSPAVVAANVAWIRVKNRIRLWTGRDDPASAALRRTSISEGLRMPVPARGQGN